MFAGYPQCVGKYPQLIWGVHAACLEGKRRVSGGYPQRVREPSFREEKSTMINELSSMPSTLWETTTHGSITFCSTKGARSMVVHF